jgi:asparagine synthase (glutamine-hydrolysing)
MCGIAGWIDYNKNISKESKIAEDMCSSLKRRGPDAQGIFFDNSAVLCHRRLIVVDPENGCQPMIYKHNGETYILIYNGELYNTEEIRIELIAKGYTFYGHSDTEVLLKAYIEWKKGCLDKLNGIYAFAVWHKNAKKLFAARDRIGVKPFFFYKYNKGIIFASEIKSLMKNPIIPAIIDEFCLNQLLLIGPGRSGGCGCIKGINELKPGEYLTFDNNSFKVKTYWRLTAKEHTDNEKHTIEKTNHLINEAIKRQLVSDVPLACFLSGGLDSSIISMITAKDYKKKNQKLTTYSVDYEDNDKYFVSNSFQPNSDNTYIQIMSSFIESDHKKIVLDNLEVAKALTDSTYARDLPGMADVDSSLLLFCKEIKKEHTVCLSGECADEIFGGYPWYHNKEILFTETFPWSNSVELRKHLFKKDVLIGDSQGFVKNEYDKIINYTDFLPTDNKFEKRMREMFMLNFYSFMQTLLDRKDRMSMYNGLEVRVPFCEHNLVEYAFNMPWELKSLNGREKGIVREAFKGQLPNEIIERKKSPYPKTYNPIFLNYVKSRVIEIYENGGILKDIINKKFFYQLINGKIELKTPWYGQLMRIPQIFAYLIQIDTFFNTFNLQIEL